MKLDKQAFIDGIKQYAANDGPVISLVDIITAGPFRISKIRHAITLAELLMVEVERLDADARDIGEESGTGDDKLDAIVSWLDDVVKLPKLLEWLDGPVIRRVITAAVDQYNDELGHNWITKVRDIM